MNPDNWADTSIPRPILVKNNHFWRTVERNNRWVSECVKCHATDDVEDLSMRQLQELANIRGQEECPISH